MAAPRHLRLVPPPAPEVDELLEIVLEADLLDARAELLERQVATAGQLGQVEARLERLRAAGEGR